MHREDLYRLGFTEKESAVYLALLNLGPSPASTLARLTQIKRTSMYDVLNGLMERNLVSSFRQGRYTYFVVDDVNKLYLHEKQKMELAKHLVKQLKDTQKHSLGIQVTYYKGAEGYRELYEDMLNQDIKEFVGWIHLDNFYKALDMDREEGWTEERIAKKIKVRLLMQDSPAAEGYRAKDAESHRETRLIPKDFPFKTTCLLYNNFIVLFDASGSDVTAIRIHNPELYKMQLQIFEMAWVSAA